MNTGFLGPAVATVLTVYGIETDLGYIHFTPYIVATVLTVYGIETYLRCFPSNLYPAMSCNSTYRLRY